MKPGIDVSTYLEELQHGAKYYDGDTQIDPLDAFRANGVEYVRTRVWNDPRSEKGEPYLAGNCGMENFLALAKLVTDKGFELLLDLHYSDFWADPAKQVPPKAWATMGLEELENAVYQFTRNTIERIKSGGYELPLIQIGNEITNGMLWPVGRLKENEDGTRGNYEPLCRLLKAGIRATREISPQTRIILHLERSHDAVIYDEFFTNMEKFGVDYDIIGASYYPYWHGTLADLFANLNNCKRFNKQIMIMELGYGFTLENYVLEGGSAARLVVDQSNAEEFGFVREYPISPKGQAMFVKEFLCEAEKNGVECVFYWEPLWIPGKDICWASEQGQEYIGEGGKSTTNEWANQCLFDYSGKMLPAFKEFSTNTYQYI